LTSPSPSVGGLTLWSLIGNVTFSVYTREVLETMVRKKLGRGRKNRCRFCTKEGCPRPAFVDYKDVQGLKKMCTSQGKIFSRKRSGNCAAFQRAVKDAIKRARFMALLPYVGE
jgi:small subunit ribosomal protein S18